MNPENFETLGPRGVLFLHSADEAYGADRVLLTTVRSNLRHGRPCFVLLPDDSPAGWLSEQLSSLGVPYDRGPLAVARRAYLSLQSMPKYLVSVLVARRYVRNMARALQPGIIHINTSALLVGAIIGRPANSRRLWHVHEIIQRPRVLAWIFRAAPLSAHHVIVVSEAVRNNLMALRKGKVSRIYNGLPERDSPQRDFVEDALVTIAYVGRLSAWKGYLLFLDLARRLAKLRADIRFIVAGAPPPGEEWRVADLRDRLETGSIEEQVTYLGFQPDAAVVYNQADIVVVPSIQPDPLPTVVLEAMQAGCVVLASDHGGPREMIVHGVTGLLVPPRDVESLAVAVLKVVDDRILRQTLSENAQHRIRTHFSEESYGTGLEGCYDSLFRGSQVR